MNEKLNCTIQKLLIIIYVECTAKMDHVAVAEPAENVIECETNGYM